LCASASRASLLLKGKIETKNFRCELFENNSGRKTLQAMGTFGGGVGAFSSCSETLVLALRFVRVVLVLSGMVLLSVCQGFTRARRSRQKL
jgi:hypothetical protein